MERKELFYQPPQAPGTSESFNVDIKRVLYRALRYWYIIALSILAALVIAFLVNRYSVRVYPVTASLIVKEAEDISGAELLYNNPLLNFKRNYLNELYIIKSYPLVERVIEDLNFDVAFYREGNVITTEAYGDIPARAVALREESKRSASFTFTALSEETFRLEAEADSGAPLIQEFRFNDTIAFAGFKGAFVSLGRPEILSIVNEPLIFRYTPSFILADRYVNDLNVEWAEEGAGVVNLHLNGSNPEKLRDFLAGLISEYQKNDLENKNETASRTVKFISEQLDGISDSLRLVERQLQRFKDKNVVTDLTGEALRLYEKVESLEAEKAQIQVSKNYYKYLIDYIQRNRDLHQIILPSSIGIDDPILSELISTMNEIQLDIKMSTKAENPFVKDGVKRITEMKKDIIESVKNQESTDDIKLGFLSKQTKEIEKQLADLPLAERTLVSIQRNYALQENLYIFLLQKKSEAAISQASTTSDILTVNPPKVGAAISPKQTINYLIAISLGICVPVLLFVFLEVLDTRVQSKEDIEKLSTIPFIGGLGHKTQNSNLAVLEKPKSVLAESFRALRSNLNYFVGQKDKAIFLVTSSISGEGKSFTSINLAAVFALSGKRTLIVGADMRRPKIFDDFNLKNDFGLSTYLAGIRDFDGVVQQTGFKNLDFVSGGAVPPNPSELLTSERMSSFIAESKLRYDFVVIDTPPLGVVIDAFVLSIYADHVLFVVRQNYTRKELLKTIEEYFVSGKLKNISITLNDIQRSGPGYGYGYSHGYGYGYGYLAYSKADKKNAGGYYEDH